jgi:hypothetical protein
VNKHLRGYLHLLDWSQHEPAPTLVPSPSLSEASRRAIFIPGVKFWLWEKQPKTWHLQGDSKQTQPTTKLGRYHSMKGGCLFVCLFALFVLMRSTELGCFRSCSWCHWKALD